MPDFDIDFCQDNRWRVIEYVREQATARRRSRRSPPSARMASKAVIRDVGRVLDMPYTFCDQLSKLIPVVQNKPVSLAEGAGGRSRRSRSATQARRRSASCFDARRPLEDLTRNVGMHAGGVLIAPGKLTDFCPLYQATGHRLASVAQFDKDDVEAVGPGQVRLPRPAQPDHHRAGRRVHQPHDRRAARPRCRSSFDDPAAYQILKDANTTAIFQVESRRA